MGTAICQDWGTRKNAFLNMAEMFCHENNAENIYVGSRSISADFDHAADLLGAIIAIGNRFDDKIIMDSGQYTVSHGSFDGQWFLLVIYKSDSGR